MKLVLPGEGQRPELCENGPWPARTHRLQVGSQAPSLNPFGRLRSDKLQDRGQDIEQGNWCFNLCPRLDLGWVGHDERDPELLVVEGVLVAHGAVVFELLAVVGRENDDRRVIPAGLSDLLEQGPKACIREADFAIVQRDRVAIVVCRLEILRLVQGHEVPFRSEPSVVVREVSRSVGGGSVVGLVRVDQVKEHEERTGLEAATNAILVPVHPEASPRDPPICAPHAHPVEVEAAIVSPLG